MPHMKAEDAKRVSERYRRALTPPEDRPKPAHPLHSLFRDAGFAVREVPAPR